MTFVVLIADGDVDAGLGHLSRCSSLALALWRQGGALTRTLGLGLEAPTERYGIPWEPATEPNPVGADAIVIDSYRATDELRARLASVAPVVAFSDDDRDFPEVALVIRSGSEANRAGELAGLPYACLGPEFWQPPSRRLASNVERVLVTTGGGDRIGVGPALARSLRDALPTTEVVLVRGPYAPQTDIFDGIRVVSAPHSLFDLLVDADIVVSAAGQTMLEALAVGTPCVALVTADNQVRQANELRAAGAVTIAGSVERAAAASRSLAADLERRHEQVWAGQCAIDGRGAMRAAAAVLKLARAGCAA